MKLDRLTATGAALAMAGCLLLPYFQLRPNRLATGTGLSIFALGAGAAIPLGFALLGAAAALVRDPRARGTLAVAAGVGLAASTLWSQGAAVTLTAGLPSAGRLSVGAGAWVALLAAAALDFAGRRSLGPGRRAVEATIYALGVAVVAVSWMWGGLDSTGLAREYAVRSDTFWSEVGRHLFLAGSGVAAGAIIGVPLGVWAARDTRVRDGSLAVVSIVETIPSLALLGLLVAPLAGLGRAFPALRELGIRGIGPAPAVIALTLYALLPLVRNTYVGLDEVDRAALDAGRGMGMSARQLFFRVELPLALPLVIEGVRVAAIMLVGIAAVTALAGARGLGFFVFEGLNQAAPDLTLLGAIPIILLALAVDGVLRALSSAAVSPGIRVRP